MRSIVILAGASGVGKTSVAAEILSRNDEYRLIRSATTRAPRGDSHDGEYIYVSEEEFKELIFRGELLEYMNYGGNFYGTPVSEINLAFSLGKTPLLILDIEGVKSL
ncbi:MAG: guanylate kinase, partial [Clostridia bacterium]|nr:guanylate kinase [Clostridia bacterium]